MRLLLKVHVAHAVPGLKASSGVVWRLTDKWVSAATCSVGQMSPSLHLRWADGIWSAMSPLALGLGIVTRLAKVLHGDGLILFAICHILYTMSVKPKKTMWCRNGAQQWNRDQINTTSWTIFCWCHLCLIQQITSQSIKKLARPPLPRRCARRRAPTSTLLFEYHNI